MTTKRSSSFIFTKQDTYRFLKYIYSPFPAQENSHTLSDILNFLASIPWLKKPNSLEQEGAAILSGFQKGEISQSLFHNCSLKAYNFQVAVLEGLTDAQAPQTSLSGREYI